MSPLAWLGVAAVAVPVALFLGAVRLGATLADNASGFLESDQFRDSLGIARAPKK